MNNQNSVISDSLTKVYQILKFTPEEIKNALADLAGIQQIAVATELLKSLTEAEVSEINAVAQKSEEEKKAAMEKVAMAHKDDADFAARAKASAKRVVDEHVVYLKTRGDEGQKAQIAQVLAGMG